MKFKDVLWSYEFFATNLPFARGRFVLEIPGSGPDAEWFKQNRDLIDEHGIPVVFDTDIRPNDGFVPLNTGTAFGLLRRLEPGRQPSFRDIVILPILPNDLSRVAGIITEVPQATLSHVNLRAVQNAAPNAFVKDAASLESIAPLIGKFVRYEVTSAAYHLREATRSEVEAFFDDLRPREPQELIRDLEQRATKNLDDLGFADSAAFGVKAANVAELRKISSISPVPEGFAIPFSFYDSFMKHNGLYSAAAQMASDSRFDEDLEFRDAALAGLRKRIRDAAMPTALQEAIGLLQSEFAGGVPIRCRSSTNNEDLSGFNGAGLYDSFTHHTDEGHLSKSIKQVFASLWNLRAYEEREFYRIDHSQVAMGVLVHPASKNELANGVGVSRNIVLENPPTDIGDFYYFNTQVGEDLVTNPEAASIPEEILVRKVSTGSQVISYLTSSNRLPEGQEHVLEEPVVNSLVLDLEKTHDHFRKLYHGDKSFAIEIEFKLDSEGSLLLKQARPWVD